MEGRRDGGRDGETDGRTEKRREERRDRGTEVVDLLFLKVTQKSLRSMH